MSTLPQALVDFARHDAARAARNRAADVKLGADPEARFVHRRFMSWTRHDAEVAMGAETVAKLDREAPRHLRRKSQKVADWPDVFDAPVLDTDEDGDLEGGPVLASSRLAHPSPSRDDELSLVPDITLGQLRRRREARIFGTDEEGEPEDGPVAAEGKACWDAAQDDSQDWEDVSVAERAAVRRAIDKFRSLTEPARKSASGARSDPATRPATISSTGPAADGDSIPPSAAAVSRRAAR
jgi:hypothetical protein